MVCQNRLEDQTCTMYKTSKTTRVAIVLWQERENRRLDKIDGSLLRHLRSHICPKLSNEPRLL